MTVSLISGSCQLMVEPEDRNDRSGQFEAASWNHTREWRASMCKHGTGRRRSDCRSDYATAGSEDIEVYRSTTCITRVHKNKTYGPRPLYASATKTTVMPTCVCGPRAEVGVRPVQTIPGRLPWVRVAGY